MIMFNKVYSGQLKNISFDIARREFVVIYDKNIEILDRLLDLFTGKATPEKGVVRSLSYTQEQLIKEIGIVYRENILLSDRSLEENLRFVMEVKEVNHLCREVRLRKIAKIFQFADCLRLKAENLNPYQLVKGNIAQGIINYPSILIVQDPSSTLDEVNSQALLHLLEKLNGLSLTLIVLSSDLNFTRRSNKRVIQPEKAVSVFKRKDFYA